MIELHLLPDGAAELPAEARDHGILATLLEGNGPPADTPAGGWRGIERVVETDRMTLRLPGARADYAQGALDGIAQAVTSGVNGLKRHPDGWQETDE